jgi:antirestriction protein ArdC
MSGTDVYQEVTDRMIRALEQGTVPWRRPWSATAGRPRSISTGRAYQGINTWLLGMTSAEHGYSSPWWGTFHQIRELGGQVRKGQNRQNGCGATLISLWRTFAPKDAEPDPETGEVREVAMGRLIPVFNADQCDGLPVRFYPVPGVVAEGIEDCDSVVSGYLSNRGPSLAHDGAGRAFYRITDDSIHLPPAASFASPAHRYATTYHEMIHSTGHPSRLDIPESGHNHFGDAAYSKEELRAEMGAAMLCAQTGIDTVSLFENSAAYIADWLSALKDDRKLVISAASAAEKAADLVMEPTRQATTGASQSVTDAEIEAA